jgi:dTDP-4-amino-4,6-dideoxygalactose transaminase
VLAPTFHHGSEIEAFEQAGLRCRFYPMNDAFAPDSAELDELLGPEVRALHLIHYLGFPQATASWRAWCDERELLLVEDAAQAWLAEADGDPVGSLGDISVFCLYKTYGVPDGAALRTSRPPARLDAGPPAVARIGRRHASWLLQRSGTLSWMRERIEGPVALSHADDIALGPTDGGLSPATVRVIDRLGPEAAPVRRANYRWLADRLLGLVPEPFRAVPEGASPFVLPVDVDDKDGLMARLRNRRIDALSLWTLPHPSLTNGCTRAESARHRWVGLPVHQELSRDDLERIAEAVPICL